jgi:LacI family transcriptional regulator
MAMGAYQAAAALGLRIPEDMSIVGFDDQQIISAGLRPGLTTVALPHLEMGEWAVHALMKLIHSDGQETVEPAVLPCPLVRRASVGPPSGV